MSAQAAIGTTLTLLGLFGNRSRRPDYSDQHRQFVFNRTLAYLEELRRVNPEYYHYNADNLSDVYFDYFERTSPYGPDLNKPRPEPPGGPREPKGGIPPVISGNPDYEHSIELGRGPR
jgi:hypothetical protein